MRADKPLRSLRSKALQLLAQREQSRVELRRKLTAHALAEEAARASPDAAGTGADRYVGGPRNGSRAVDPGDGGGAAEDPAPHAASRVDDVLAWLDAHCFQSDARFAESRINARSGRYGDLRIRRELKQHGVALDADAARALGETEKSRAWAVWQRRFGVAPATPADAAKQSRFLTARGFSPDAVRQILRRARTNLPGDDGEEAPFDGD